MSTEATSRLTGEIISVNHCADSCRITIEFRGDLSQTAAVMKQALVDFGAVEGAAVNAAVNATQVLIDVGGREEGALPC
jgi:hypothetical protein